MILRDGNMCPKKGPPETDYLVVRMVSPYRNETGDERNRSYEFMIVVVQIYM